MNKQPARLSRHDPNPRVFAIVGALQSKVKSFGAVIVKPVFSFLGGRRFQFTEPSENEFAVWSATGS
jgi:predicted enzyme related to lactoylglutathione lyase